MARVEGMAARNVRQDLECAQGAAARVQRRGGIVIAQRWRDGRRAVSSPLSVRLDKPALLTNLLNRDSDTNLKTMRTKLKKNCISILTDQHFDAFDAIDPTSQFPQIDVALNESQGAYARFFEQAFEWKEMTWLTYPYYWGASRSGATS